MALMELRTQAATDEQVRAWLAEAKTLFPSFIRSGETLPVQELARHRDYRRMLRLGILIWMTVGEEAFRKLIETTFGLPGEDAHRQIMVLWQGIDTGCVPATSPPDETKSSYAQTMCDFA